MPILHYIINILRFSHAPKQILVREINEVRIRIRVWVYEN